ncbi:MAG: hypothetical protein H6713_32070 [Myxococcales bacterium]|nr:hypothetical protein [Myxococcales bacterium]
MTVPTSYSTPATSSRRTILELTTLLLRDPQALIDAGDREQALGELAPRLLAITCAGASLFGLVVGSYRGGVQHLYAAVKMPLLLLLPVLVGLPAIRALYAACEVHTSRSRLGLAALAGMARTAVLAAACAPLLWLLYSVHISYHRAILVMTACLLAVGLPGLTALTRGLPRGGQHRWLASAGSVIILGALLAQSGWLLRPFVVRPRAEATFLRAIQADVFSSLNATYDSSKGRYRGWSARSHGFIGAKAAPPPPPPSRRLELGERALAESASARRARASDLAIESPEAPAAVDRGALESPAPPPQNMSMETATYATDTAADLPR